MEAKFSDGPNLGNELMDRAEVNVAARMPGAEFDALAVGRRHMRKKGSLLSVELNAEVGGLA